jgi:uncharacterized membrane protein
MRQHKKVKKSILKSIRIWLEKRLGLRCPECGGKTSFHHYKKCSHYKKETIEPLICIKCIHMDSFTARECQPNPDNTCEKFKANVI